MALGQLPGSGSDYDSEDESGAIFADINITPLTDIFLVLLIIFMVTSSIAVDDFDKARASGVKVNLPKGATKEIDTIAKSLVISVMADGKIMVQGEVRNAGDLQAMFKSAFVSDPMTQVIIEADEGVNHGSVVAVMNLAKESGLSKLAIATNSGE